MNSPIDVAVNSPALTLAFGLSFQELYNRGLYTRMRGETICLAPPLVSTVEQVDRMIAILREAIPAATQG